MVTLGPISGLPTVIARDGDHYAFHVGTQLAAAEKDVPAQQDKFKNIDSVLLLENFYSGNTINIEERSKQVDEQMRKDRRGYRCNR
ncbi:MAG: hypothetical protein R3E96_01230 [Planctomycetota bacterium]